MKFLFSHMTERRVTEIMCKPGRFYDLWIDASQFAYGLGESLLYILR